MWWILMCSHITCLKHHNYFTFELRKSRKIAQPPLPNSSQLANQVLGYLQSNPHNLFPQFNGPQLSAIGAALTRRLTMIQGPPGTYRLHFLYHKPFLVSLSTYITIF